ncbi:type II toxin-antitoxin system RelE family toxin [Thermodesulfatator atlanticus]
MKKIEWTPKAFRQLRKIKSKEEQIKIYEAVSELKNFPSCRNIKKLKGTPNLYRLRVGRWRVIFSERLTVIAIEEVKKRNERTYR